MNKVKITLKPIENPLDDARYKIVQLENAIKVHSGSKEFHVNDSITEGEAEQILRDRHNKVTVKS